MIKECIILAGGLGTRLKTVVHELPKCLAPVNGKPFITYVIQYLQMQGIEKFIFALGYKSEAFNNFLSSFPENINYKLSIEHEPLGTGGAIKLSCSKASVNNILIANGDTLFKINMHELSDFHSTYSSDCTLSLKPMTNFNRYGVVEIDKNFSIKNFYEKRYYREGLINGGLYILNVDSFLKENLPEKFSFEKDYLEKLYSKRKMYGFIQDKYFIDIGIPEDYNRAQLELID